MLQRSSCHSFPPRRHGVALRSAAQATVAQSPLWGAESPRRDVGVRHGRPTARRTSACTNDQGAFHRHHGRTLPAPHRGLQRAGTAPLPFGLHVGTFDALGLVEYSQRFGFGEAIERDDAPARGMAVAPEVEGFHARTVARRWLMARARPSSSLPVRRSAASARESGVRLRVSSATATQESGAVWCDGLGDRCAPDAPRPLVPSPQTPARPDLDLFASLF